VARRKKSRQILLRFYPGQDDELIAWLDQFDDRPYGAKSQAIKEALRRGIGAVTDPGGLAMDEDRLLQLIKTGVLGVLVAYLGPRDSRASLAAQTVEDDEIEGLLDHLGASMTISDDD
jgi:hypothetical protein